MQVTYLGNSTGLNQSLKIPLFHEAVSAGFPSPAQDYIEQELDLNQEEWDMRRQFFSPAYTTRWEDLPRVR